MSPTNWIGLKVKKESSASICPYCRSEIRSSNDAVICLKCRTLHHQTCWRANRQCSVFGCSSTELLTSLPNAVNLKRQETVFFGGAAFVFVVWPPMSDFLLSWLLPHTTGEIISSLSFGIWLGLTMLLFMLWLRFYRCPICRFSFRNFPFRFQEETACPKCGVAVLSNFTSVKR